MSEPSPEEGLRFIFAGDSIVSDWGNPEATTHRAVMTALIALGHEATYLEPRGSAPMIGLLHARGSAPVRAFLASYPRLQYRTIDLPEPYAVIPWAGKYLATASAAIVLKGTSPVVAAGFAEFASPDMQLLIEEGGPLGTSVLREQGTAHRAVAYRPAVMPRRWDGPRVGSVVVAYDDAALARQVAARAPDARLIVSGRAGLPDWEFVPEVDLPPIFGGAQRVLIVDSAERPLAPERVWLPRANGAAAWGVVAGGAPLDISVAIDIAGIAGLAQLAQPVLPEAFDANQLARRLVDLVLQPGGAGA